MRAKCIKNVDMDCVFFLMEFELRLQAVHDMHLTHHIMQQETEKKYNPIFNHSNRAKISCNVIQGKRVTLRTGVLII